MDRIIAEESLRNSEIIAMGSGNMKEDAVKERVGKWQYALEGGIGAARSGTSKVFDRIKRVERPSPQEIGKTLLASGWKRIRATPRQQ